MRILDVVNRYLSERSSAVMVFATFKLESLGNRLGSSVPKNMDEILVEMSEEPPNICLRHPRFFENVFLTEKYTVPLEIKELGDRENGYYTFFEETRTGVDLENDWEFDRHIVVECYRNFN